MIFKAVIIGKLTYAASAWWSFTTADDRQRLESVVRRGIRSGLCAADQTFLAALVEDADDNLFNIIIIIIIIDDYGRRRMPLSPHLLQLVINT